MEPLDALVRTSTDELSQFNESGLVLHESRSKKGILMDFYTFDVLYVGERIGELHIVDAVTFRSAVYIGTKPGETENIRIESNQILRDPGRFDRLKEYRKLQEQPPA